MIRVLGAVSDRRAYRAPARALPDKILDPYASYTPPTVLDPYANMPAAPLPMQTPLGATHEERSLALLRVGDYVGALRAYGAARSIGPAVAAEMALARVLGARCT